MTAPLQHWTREGESWRFFPGPQGYEVIVGHAGPGRLFLGGNYIMQASVLGGRPYFRGDGSYRTPEAACLDALRKSHAALDMLVDTGEGFGHLSQRTAKQMQLLLAAEIEFLEQQL